MAPTNAAAIERLEEMLKELTQVNECTDKNKQMVNFLAAKRNAGLAVRWIFGAKSDQYHEYKTISRIFDVTLDIYLKSNTAKVSLKEQVVDIHGYLLSLIYEIKTYREEPTIKETKAAPMSPSSGWKRALGLG